MAIFGDLSDMSTPEVLNMLGPRTGKLFIRPASTQEYEIHLREGVIHCLKDNGFPVQDTTALRHRVTDLLRMRAGSFEFTQTPLTALEYEFNFSRNEIWQITASLEAGTSTEEHIPDQATRFRLKSTFNPDIKLPEDMLDFMRKSHDLLFSGCSASELAETLKTPVAQVQHYFQRLRTLDRITPVRAYATNYGSYSSSAIFSADEPANSVAAPPTARASSLNSYAPPARVPVAAASGPASYSRSVVAAAAAKSYVPPAPRPKQSFVQRLLSVFSFGGK